MSDYLRGGLLTARLTCVFDVEPEDVVGEVQLLKLAVHLRHVPLVLVVPPALVVPQREDGRQGLGACVQRADGQCVSIEEVLDRQSRPAELGRDSFDSPLTDDVGELLEDSVGQGARQQEQVDDARLAHPVRIVRGALHPPPEPKTSGREDRKAVTYSTRRKGVAASCSGRLGAGTQGGVGWTDRVEQPYRGDDVDEGFGWVEEEGAGGERRRVAGDEGDGAVERHGLVQLVLEDVQVVEAEGLAVGGALAGRRLEAEARGVLRETWLSSVEAGRRPLAQLVGGGLV